MHQTFLTSCYNNPCHSVVGIGYAGQHMLCYMCRCSVVYIYVYLQCTVMACAVVSTPIHKDKNIIEVKVQQYF